MEFPRDQGIHNSSGKYIGEHGIETAAIRALGLFLSAVICVNKIINPDKDPTISGRPQQERTDFNHINHDDPIIR